jgi:hypothetical protein
MALEEERHAEQLDRRLRPRLVEVAGPRHAAARSPARGAARGDVVGKWYSEKRSGKVLARPELDRLRADARTGKVGKLYCYRLDTFPLIEELRACGVEVITVAIARTW